MPGIAEGPVLGDPVIGSFDLQKGSDPQIENCGAIQKRSGSSFIFLRLDFYFNSARFSRNYNHVLEIETRRIILNYQRNPSRTPGIELWNPS